MAQLWLNWETSLKEAQLDDFKAYKKFYLTSSYEFVGLENCLVLAQDTENGEINQFQDMQTSVTRHSSNSWKATSCAAIWTDLIDDFNRESMDLHKKAPCSEKEEYSVRLVEPGRPRIHLSHDAPCLGHTIFPH